MSSHTPQSASVLRRAVQQVLSRGLSDPRIRGLISVTKVDLSPDGATATVYLSIHPEKHASTTMHGVRHGASHIRSQVGDLVAMRRVPRLVFREDRGIKKQTEVLRALQDVAPPAAHDDREHTTIDPIVEGHSTEDFAS